MTYSQIVETLESLGYVIFGCSHRSDGAMEFTAAGPNGAGVRRVSVRVLPGGNLKIW